MADKPIGFVFNQQLLTMILGAIALFGSVFAGVTWINDRVHYEQVTSAEIVELKAQDEAQISANKELTGEIKGLGEAVSDLALTLKEVEVIQRTTPLTGQITAVPNIR